MKRVQELDIALGRLQGERIDPRAIFAYAVNPAAIQFDHALVAAADVEDVGEAAIFLFKRDDLVPMNGLAGPGWPEDEHDPHAIHIHVLKERRPCARLEDVQVLGVQILGVRMSEMRSEHRGKPRMMVLRQP